MVVLLRDARFTRYDVKDESSGRRRYIVYASPLSSSPLSSSPRSLCLITAAVPARSLAC